STAAQTELSILTSFLLSRAPLTDIITLKSFTDLFPREKRSNPQVKLLYRKLQLIRAQTCDRVRRNVELEVVQGKRQRKRAFEAGRSKSLAATMDELSGDTMMGVELFGTSNYEPVLPLKELLLQMEDAAEELAAEERRLEADCNRLLEEMQTWVGDLSDLKYGKFSTPGIQGKVIEQLANLTETCERVL
ncbi:Cnl2/NKP2 family protein-domain-containing protein, partial [Kalaharituber pfeilii]